MELFVYGVLGLIVGSFLNVVVNREDTDEGLGGRSHCPACKKTLSAMDLIPVFSWLFLRGRCRFCAAPISLQYPLVELLTAALFMCVGAAPLPFVLQFLALIIVALCISIAVFDLKHMLIPDAWNYLFAIFSLAYGFFGVEHAVVPLLWLFVSGPLVSFPLWSLWYFSGGRWMGFGDVKFAVGMGWLLGAFDGYTALFGAFILGAIVSVCILLPLGSIISYAQRRGLFQLREGGSAFTMKSEVPFGPFLVASFITVWFLTLFGVKLFVIL